MRPKLSELCKIKPHELRLLSHEEASLKIINLLKESRAEIALELKAYLERMCKDYDYLSSLNWKLQYIDRTIESREQDYEEMMS